MKRVHLYVLKEMALPFGLALALLTFLLIMSRLLALVDMVLKNGVPFFTALELVTYVLPATFALTVPMALLVAVLLALGRLASDLELVALRAGGVSPARLLPPLLALGLVFSLGMLAFNETLLPRANESYKSLFFDVLRQRSDVALQEQSWIKDFQGMLLYVDQKDADSKELRGLTILRPGQGNEALQWVRAKRGKLVSEAEGYGLYLDLYEGSLQTTGGLRAQDLTEMDFAYSRVDLDLDGVLSQMQGKERQPQEMSMREIHALTAKMGPKDGRLAHFLTEMHKKAAIPFACLFFVLCGLPLGTLTRKGGRMLGFVMAIGLIFAYYLLLSVGQTYGDEGRLPPILAMWLPNLGLALLAGFASYGAFKERGIFSFGRG